MWFTGPAVNMSVSSCKVRDGLKPERLVQTVVKEGPNHWGSQVVVCLS